MQPALTRWLQVQPIDPIGPGSDVQSEVGRKQVAILCDATLTTVYPLGERLLLFRPAQTRLRQGRRSWDVFVELLSAGAFSLAAQHVYEQPWCPVAHTAREVLLPRHIIESLTGDIDPVLTVIQDEHDSGVDGEDVCA